MLMPSRRKLLRCLIINATSNGLGILDSSLFPSIYDHDYNTRLKASFGESIKWRGSSFAFCLNPRSRVTQSNVFTSFPKASFRMSSSQRFRERLENPPSPDSSGSSSSSN